MRDLEYNYEPELDILSVDDTGKDYERSVRSGDFIVDLDSEGELRGVEVQNVSEMLGIDKEQLKGISDVELNGVAEEGIKLTLRLKIDQQVNTLAAQITEERIPV